MDKNSKIYVAGHRGMVGSAILENLQENGYNNLITKTRNEVDLLDYNQVEKFFAEYKPEYIFLAAAKVGGIIANMQQGADFITENIKIQTNIIELAYKNQCKKLLFLGSSCIYPKMAPQPMKEEYLLTGLLEETNLPYAIAKIAGKVMCDAYKAQYNFNSLTVMPSNVYGKNDNFHPENSHVVAGLMRRFHEAKLENKDKVIVWGSGKPMRELINAKDLASACVFLMENYHDGGMVNIGTSEEISIHDLAFLMKEITGFKGDVEFDPSKPDGTPRKIMDNSIIENLGWKRKIDLKSGLRDMYQFYLSSL